MKYIVYYMDSPQGSQVAQEFFVMVNGVGWRGKCGVEVELPEEALEALNNAVIDRTVLIDGVETREIIPRYRVIPVGSGRTEGQSSKLYMCQECGKEFKDEKALEEHGQTHVLKKMPV